MDVISFSEAATANGRIESFIENPDSMSGIVTVPKVIASGENITIPAGRVAVLPNVQVDGELNIEGEVFIPSGATFADLESQIALKANINSPTFTGTPTAPTPNTGDNSTKLATTAYVDGKMVLGTAVNATGTAIDFTGIPSWVKRITVMFNGVSTNSTGVNAIAIRLGGVVGGLQTSGYVGTYGYVGSGGSQIINNASAIGIYNDLATDSLSGRITIELQSKTSNTWVFEGSISIAERAYVLPLSGGKTLSETLDKLRITTINGTAVFDAGSINIMYEG